MQYWTDIPSFPFPLIVAFPFSWFLCLWAQKIPVHTGEKWKITFELSKLFLQPLISIQNSSRGTSLCFNLRLPSLRISINAFKTMKPEQNYQQILRHPWELSVAHQGTVAPWLKNTGLEERLQSTGPHCVDRGHWSLTTLTWDLKKYII